MLSKIGQHAVSITHREGMSKNATRVLLVEDNEDDEKLTLRALRKIEAATDITVAHDGEEAMDRLFADGESAPGLVLLDLKLPKLGGIELLEKVRADSRFEFTPVVVLTSSDERRDIESCYRLGANSYIRKPVDFTEFITTVGQVGTYWLSMNRLPR